MIEFRSIPAAEWRKFQPLAIALFRRHNDGHITRKAFNHIQQLRSKSLEQPGNVVWSVWDDRRLVATLVVERFGARTAASVVHRDYRGQGINKRLLLAATRQMGRFYGEIASDNLPSLRSAFAVGMVAYDAFVRRGKVTLRIRNGFDPKSTE